MIRVIELDIRVENICLKDRFEWDINDPNNVPEVVNSKLVCSSKFIGLCTKFV